MTGRRDRPRSCRTPSEAGSTFVEVLAAVAIFSIVVGVLWFVIGSSIRHVDAARDRRRMSTATLNLDGEFRRFAARIRPPYWLEAVEVKRDGDRAIRIPYLDGIAESWLEVEIGAVLSLATSAGERRAYPALRATAVEVLEEDEVAYALSLAIADSASPLVAPFGSTTVPSTACEPQPQVAAAGQSGDG